MNISVTRLTSGYFHIRGVGPCNWAQPHLWPCSEDELRKAAFPEASDDFIRAAMKAATVSQSDTLEASR